MKMKLLRQGDVLLVRVDVMPALHGAVEEEDRILARGEATGHNHRITGPAKVLRSGQQLYVLAEQEAELVHEEHDTIRVPQGIWRVVRQREYDPTAERVVTD